MPAAALVLPCTWESRSVKVAPEAMPPVPNPLAELPLTTESVTVRVVPTSLRMPAPSPVQVLSLPSARSMTATPVPALWSPPAATGRPVGRDPRPLDGEGAGILDPPAHGGEVARDDRP